MTEGIRKLKAKHMRHCVADFAWQLRYIPAGILLDLGFLVSFLLNGREKREREMRSSRVILIENEREKATQRKSLLVSCSLRSLQAVLGEYSPNKRLQSLQNVHICLFLYFYMFLTCRAVMENDARPTWILGPFCTAAQCLTLDASEPPYAK